jgi:hypothetical protein
MFAMQATEDMILEISEAVELEQIQQMEGHRMNWINQV